MTEAADQFWWLLRGRPHIHFLGVKVGEDPVKILGRAVVEIYHRLLPRGISSVYTLMGNTGRPNPKPLNALPRVLFT